MGRYTKTRTERRREGSPLQKGEDTDLTCAFVKEEECRGAERGGVHVPPTVSAKSTRAGGMEDNGRTENWRSGGTMGPFSLWISPPGKGKDRFRVNSLERITSLFFNRVVEGVGWGVQMGGGGVTGRLGKVGVDQREGSQKIRR